MTRIDPNFKILSDQHLRSNLREITRPLKKVLKRIENGKGFDCIPDSYRLGTGHESFFFDKLLWLELQFEFLNDEHIRRFGKPSTHYTTKVGMVSDSVLEVKKHHKYKHILCKNWQPTQKEIKVWCDYMINKKIPELKTEPTYEGKVIGKQGYIDLITNNI